LESRAELLIGGLARWPLYIAVIAQLSLSAPHYTTNLQPHPQNPCPSYTYLLDMSSTISSTVSPSSPAMTPNKVNAATDKDALLAASSPAPPTLKDLRSFEHDRQRVKKAADLVKMRARKGQGRWSSLAKGELYNSSRKNAAPLSSEKEKRLRADEVDALEGSLAESRGDVDGLVPSRNVSQPSEVKLSDLVTFRNKPRKALDGEFVVIPPHRSVIVLDDIHTHDLLVDEPWEHIYGTDDEEPMTTKNGLSYADVLLTHAK